MLDQNFLSAEIFYLKTSITAVLPKFWRFSESKPQPFEIQQGINFVITAVGIESIAYWSTYIVFCVFVRVGTCAGVSPSLWYTQPPYKLPIICIGLHSMCKIHDYKQLQQRKPKPLIKISYRCMILIFVSHLNVPRKIKPVQCYSHTLKNE